MMDAARDSVDGSVYNGTEWNKMALHNAFQTHPPRFSSVNPTVKQRRRCENPRLSSGALALRHHHYHFHSPRNAAQRDISTLFVRSRPESFLSKKFHSAPSHVLKRRRRRRRRRRRCTNWKRQQIDSFLLLSSSPPRFLFNFGALVKT